MPDSLSPTQLIAKLRPIVEAATEGPWESQFIGGPLDNDFYLFGRETAVVGSIGVVASIATGIVPGLAPNAAYVETFDPPTVGALLDLAAAALDGTSADIETATARLRKLVR